MKTRFIFLLLTISVLNFFGQEPGLYPIKKGNLWGYIGVNGNIIIKPQFYSAGKFSEGLAPARLKGIYGYIDKTGNFIIPPAFDLALSFENGLAKVYVSGKPSFINKKGEILFQHNFDFISPFGTKNYAIVQTFSKKCGVIDRAGKLIIDTVFKNILPFTNGITVVTGLNHNPYSGNDGKKVVFEKGVIDSAGKWIVNFGTYTNISEFKNGFATVELNVSRKGYSDYKGIIDAKGDYKFTIPSKKWHLSYGNENFYENIAIIDIYSVDPDTVKTWSSNKHYDYKGALNSYGEIICSDKDWYDLTPFSHGRAFAKDKNDTWWLINTYGKKVSELSFKKILFETYRGDPHYLFENGIAFVKTIEGWGAIDTSGKFVIAPGAVPFSKENGLTRKGNIIFFEEDISVESEKYSYRYGFWNSATNITVEPRFHDIDQSGFDNKLIYVMQDERMGYIDQNGNQLWQEDLLSSSKEELNIDYMNRGYFYASSENKKELAGAGGWGTSTNPPQKISSAFKNNSNKLQLIIDTTKKVLWQEKYNGIKLFVVNSSKETYFFDAQDSRLYLNLQAQNKNGEWKDIEYLPSSWCGNSYHTLFLDPKEQWEFSIPAYSGEFKTKIRAKLLYKKTAEQKEDEILYSNEIEGFINPGQFWNKRTYYPGGLMDPYND